MAVTAVSPGAPPASAHDEGRHPRIPVVTSGDARFQILSPTLVRTEYAGDRAFTDAPTFNAIGRDDFAPTPYTARTSGAGSPSRRAR